MKKEYAKPQTTLVEVKIESLLVDYSTTEAGEKATVLGREDESEWE